MENELQIMINGKTYTPTEPKARIWREITAFNENRREIKEGEIIEAHVKIIALAFNKEITEETLLENLELADILPLYFKIYNWIMEKITEKLKKIPNDETPTE